MFFIVSHSWEKIDEEQVNLTVVNLFRKEHYGLIGNPWPKLFHFWIDPDTSSAYSHWEAQNPESLEEVLKSLSGLRSSKHHVKQLFPPHVNGYNMLDIGKKNKWDV